MKSGKKKEFIPGLDAFAKQFNVKKKLLIGSGGLSFEEFTEIDPQLLFD